MGLFERWLSGWVALAISAGIVLGQLFPGLFAALAAVEVARINLVIAVLIWLMIFPMMLAVDFSAVGRIRGEPQALIVTLAMNWLVKPFTMALLAWWFIRGLYAAWIPVALADQLVAGMILLGVAPCTAMVFVWSQLCRGNATYTVVQVAANDLVMVLAYAPIAGLLLGVSQVAVPWDTLQLSVALFVVIPLVAGWLTRRSIGSERAIERIEARLKPWSIVGLLATVLLLFGFQASTILANPALIVLVAIPLILQTVLIFALTALWMRKWRQPHDLAAPGALIGASNFFELAVAVAISLFGVRSGAALATVVGVLVEVPVMLALVAIANRSRWLFPYRSA
ncbi:ACR3 family arsenite efflux transporter [Synechococcus sp. Cruz-9H2]|uniref:ACR3 family arsenite efflux transporter n=1 Tax=unclassified Synechococcus TaxID=2626047 RepID=UPI0020CBB5B0|nr:MULTISPECIES: ACR3 family arsenite efflux transporter [unclassified Synechococcus]MCP9819427.1 ACR3 family arsenite efflux transporter [Synechococcus sp. Cruz-9H2]MCP9843221.1 ACR3 family arsenite efflux transporter [Synechococcus sp. Edmonson 11F2]MCP9854966.1 ACR3 family arsenite efflux transporter [Synechococcus sp. Cruz-9C9]MCP9862563.1 ACR3 family arsenite efflux transporter [Synechococcus sp. Cruz-7E5]MCP9870338.1 ACR3 family arsenite efflux transporter [Synechococcus sp. Cruz-7B9]